MTTRWFFNLASHVTLFMNEHGILMDTSTEKVYTGEPLAESEDWRIFDADPRDFGLETLRAVGISPN